MLRHLYIENYALIQKLEIDFQSGFSVITGETGAGKSILLGALGLILGDRADTAVLADPSVKCIVEGHFQLSGSRFRGFFSAHDLDFEETGILRREITPAGKSRAFINDTPVNLAVLKALGDQLVDIHSQHENLLLRDASFQLAVVDYYADNQDIIKKYTAEYQLLQSLLNQLREISAKEAQSRLDEDYYRFQFSELEQANPVAGECLQLESDHQLYSHSEEIKAALQHADSLFHQAEPSLLDQMSEAKNLLTEYSSYSPELEEIANRLQTGFIELKDLGSEISRVEARISYDPEKLEEIRLRLDLLYSLQKKHRLAHPDELPVLMEEIRQKLNGIEHLGEQLQAIQQKITEQTGIIQGLAMQLHQKRVAVATELSDKIVHILQRLGMPEAMFTIDISLLDSPGLLGQDKVQFLFNANKGGEAGEISRIASGGELSRIMLTLKSIVAEKLVLPTIIFDEIDMGVSGKTADMVGSILREMATGKQLIVISHLPQIAARGDHHFIVYKKAGTQVTQSSIRVLAPEERVQEIARLISGEHISQAALATATELLANNSRT